ncbi:DNA methyltransferase [Desulfococcaceae bacterium HSG8]|nr:DNA methyltransferase [Desulfococcaceae bacterium HSG8]
MSRKKIDTQTKKLFPDEQQNLFEKSCQEEMEEQRNRQVECLGMTFENDKKRREHFLEKLREKLKDPEFRKIEGFPIGEDEDILALSDPPYYTACPNPFIEDFIKQYGKPYDPNLPYSRQSFAADVSEGRSGTVYDAHTYHTKVPHKAIMRYILHYTNPGDVVLDGFAGTGMTGVAAGLCVNPQTELKDTFHGEPGERKSIIADICPAATFIAAGYANNLSPDHFKRAAVDVLGKAETEIGWIYKTQDDKSNAEEIIYTIWSDVFICPECANDVVFWDVAYDQQQISLRDSFNCKQCGSVLSKRSMERKTEAVFDSALGKVIQSPKQVPVWLSVIGKRGRYERAPNQSDLQLLRRIDEFSCDEFYPTNRMMNAQGEDLCWGDKWRAGTSNFQYIHELYTKRNLSVLASLHAHARSLKSADERLAVFFLISSYNLAHSNKMARVIFKKGAKKPVLTGYQSGTLYVSSLSVEKNIFHGIKNTKLSAIGNLLQLDTRSGIISTQSATQLNFVPSSSVDYIFTDPPFGNNLAYAELNFLTEAWLKLFTATKSEAIVSKYQHKNLNNYGSLITDTFSEYYRVLKPGRWITVEFHNSRNSVWNMIQESLLKAGFVVADVRTLDKQQSGFNAINAAKAVKQDLVISAYKPNGGLENRFKLIAGSEEGVWDFVRTHLKQLPVFVSKNRQAEIIAERQHFLLFDRMVAFHVQRGVTVPLSAAEFYAGLEQRFPPREGMYFLPDQAAEYDKKRMTVKEVLQLQLFVSDEASAIQWLRQQLTKKPQTFQEIHPQFLREMGGWQKHEKPLELSLLLEQNFLRYAAKGEVPSQIHSYLSSNFKELRNLSKDDPALKAKAKDRWYVPDPNKAGDLEKLRERSLLREFEDYRESKQKRLKVFRLEAVRAGFKKAWQERDYATIITVARKIPEKILQEDPKLLMWYDQAVTRTG